MLAIDRATKPAYVPPSQSVGAGKAQATALDPTAHKLAALVSVSSERFGAAVENLEVIALLLEDLAEALALEADRAFLHGDGKGKPHGIKARKGVHQVRRGRDELATARAILTAVRQAPEVRFRNPGWVLHPTTFDALTRLDLPKISSNPLEAGPMLQADGSDGGTLLGYPFVTSEAAKDGGSTTIFFSADWSEAWIGADRALATVDISTDAAFDSGDILIRAVMRHDFSLRTPTFFAFSS